MTVYIGPCYYGGPPEPDDRFIREDDEPTEIDDDLDMRNYRIVNLQQSEENRSDAATVGYISDWIGRINRVKVDWNGGTMEGDLNMGQFKLKQPGDPKYDEDVINKKYFVKIVMQTEPYDFGRCIVFPHADQTSTYHGAGSRKNIYLDSEKVFEIFTGNVHGRDIMRPGRLDSRTLDLSKKKKKRK